MDVKALAGIIGADFYTGVPDSQLKPLCDFLMDTYGMDFRHHVIAANEGNCAALAAGYYLATGKVPVVYMQNSGEGNVINPVASLLHKRVYAIPTVFIIGWRGEPGTCDEPQHSYQGQITLKLLSDLDIQAFVIGKDTTQAEIQEAMIQFRRFLAQGQQTAFVIRKHAISYQGTARYQNRYQMNRETVICRIAEAAKGDLVVATTGKISRELYEIRKCKGQGQQHDFLTVGSMGHCSSIALGIAIHRQDKKVWCIDGDGAVLMHMGALAVTGAAAPGNLVHVIINNCAHESVGGMPTVAGSMDFAAVARACGYPFAVRTSTYQELDAALARAVDSSELCLVEARCACESRNDLGRPSISPIENRRRFMKDLAESECADEG